MSDQEDEHPSVEIFTRVNRLKMKAGGTIGGGAGRLDDRAVERADTVIRKMAAHYPDEIRRILESLNALWGETKAMSEDSRHDNARTLSNMANQIKDLAGVFGFDLMEYFGASLRDYILDIDLSRKEEIIIVQAHIDVMQLAYSQNLKSQDHPLGEELKRTVAAAIEKYR